MRAVAEADARAVVLERSSVLLVAVEADPDAEIPSIGFVAAAFAVAEAAAVAAWAA